MIYFFAKIYAYKIFFISDKFPNHEIEVQLDLHGPLRQRVQHKFARRKPYLHKPYMFGKSYLWYVIGGCKWQVDVQFSRRLTANDGLEIVSIIFKVFKVIVGHGRIFLE